MTTEPNAPRRRSIWPGVAGAGVGLAAIALTVQLAPWQETLRDTSGDAEMPQASEKTELAKNATQPLVAQDRARLAEEAPAAVADALPQPAPIAPALMPAPGGTMAPMAMPSAAKMSKPAVAVPGVASADQGRDRFPKADDNPVKRVADNPVSTFSADVDTVSYGVMRAALMDGVLPLPHAIRTEELINYFSYDYPVPAKDAAPFATSLSIAPTPWNKDTRLLRIGLKTAVPDRGAMPPAHLVFLIDTSGSMNAPDKLPLLKNAFRLLLTTLKPEDTVAIVAYAGSAGTVLEPTQAKEGAKILAALERLDAGGSTAGGEGLRQAYALAEAGKTDGSVSRVILATDGDFNVGFTEVADLKAFVERQRASGVTLSVLGFGQGNYNDELMQALAQNGNGNAAYIDSLTEARKVLVEEVGATLFTVASDVKLQVEFNPAEVKDYRLIGYETRALRQEDFSNDKVDAGDIGAGHTVTALYEFTPASVTGGLTEPLRYQVTPPAAPAGSSDELAFLRIRYKTPGENESKLIEQPVTQAVAVDSFEAADADFRFATAVAAFGDILKGGRFTKDYTLDDVVALARTARGEDSAGHRAAFIGLVDLAKTARPLAPLPQ
ncbi:YfbK domain-containing protein [Pannonibacter sp.]|uniref:vWA domain-containing protein n=1 Tax=Pannonibacter sp. TaxID=1906786 RepID=UPI003F6F416D